MFYKFMQDERGATAIEYGMIVALIFLAILTGTGSMGQALDAMYTNKLGQANTALQ